MLASVATATQSGDNLETVSLRDSLLLEELAHSHLLCK